MKILFANTLYILKQANNNKTAKVANKQKTQKKTNSTNSLKRNLKEEEKCREITKVFAQIMPCFLMHKDLVKDVGKCLFFMNKLKKKTFISIEYNL